MSSNPFKDTMSVRIPMSMWGRDHWGTLLYLETCAVDGKGRISNDRMRTDKERHPAEWAARAHKLGCDGGSYPSRLKGGKKQPGHDDWDCCLDLIDHDLITLAPTGKGTWRVTLTINGWRYAHALRIWRALGNSTGTFVPDHMIHNTCPLCGEPCTAD